MTKISQIKIPNETTPYDITLPGLAVSAEELNYADNLTENIQDALDGLRQEDIALNNKFGNYLALSGGTMRGRLETSFKNSVAMGSYGSLVTTVEELVEEVRYSSGCMGSVSLVQAYEKSGVTIPGGWYNFVYAPHRSGGTNGQPDGDNHSYGTLLLHGMTVMGSAHFRIRISGNKIEEIFHIIDSSYRGDLDVNASSADTAAEATHAITADKATGDKNGNDIATTYLPLSGGVVSGNLTATKGLLVRGRFYGAGDDEGIIVEKAENGYAGITLGATSGVRSTLYLLPNNDAVWRYYDGNNVFNIKHPAKEGVIALSEDVNTALAELEEGLTEYVGEQIGIIIGLEEDESAVLDTIKKLSDALKNDPEVVNALEAALVKKVDKTEIQPVLEHINDKNNPHEVTAEQVRALPLYGGTLTGTLYTSAPTPLLIGTNGKVGMRANSGDTSNVGQINVSNSWYPDGDQWGAQMSALNGKTGKRNSIRVSHNGPEYEDENETRHVLLYKDLADDLYLSTAGGSVSGEVTIQNNLNLEPVSGEGGQILLNTAENDLTNNGIAIDTANGDFRIFGLASKDNTTKTGYGEVLTIDPYDKTVLGNYYYEGTAQKAYEDENGLNIADNYILETEVNTKLTEHTTYAENTYAKKADIAQTASKGTASGSFTYWKIGNFGNWGTGNWTSKNFSMLISSRAGEMVWLSLSANDSDTATGAIRLIDRYQKISALYYNIADSSIYVQAKPYANNICAHIISNLNGDYVPTVEEVTAIPETAQAINIYSFGVNPLNTDKPYKVGCITANDATAYMDGKAIATIENITEKLGELTPGLEADILAEVTELIDAHHVEALAEFLLASGDTLEGPLVVTGGDSDTAGKIKLDQNQSGQITDANTATIFGFINTSDLTIGHANYNTGLRGKQARPTYNGNSLALASDIKTLSVTETGSGNAYTGSVFDTSSNALTLKKDKVFADINVGNNFNGEQRMLNSSYCPTMNDIASGIGCSLKNSRACDNQLIVAEVYAPLTSCTDVDINMQSVPNEISFYKMHAAHEGQFTDKTLLGKINESGWVGNVTGTLNGNASSANKLNTNAGDINTPVYFEGGVPKACTSLDLNTSGSSASCTGNSATASKLETARTITLTGGATGSAEFDGTKDVSLSVTVLPESHNHRYLPLDGGGTMSGKIIITGDNPHLGLRDNATSKEAYFQTHDDGSGLKAGFGFSWVNSFRIDTVGNLFFGGTQRPQWNGSPLAITAEIPTELKNPHPLTIQGDGTSLVTYDGSSTKSVNITPENIHAARTTAPSDAQGSETITAKFNTSNGGSIKFGKEGPNSGTMIRLDQEDGTCRLRFRASDSPGAMVWEQPEAGANLYIDLGAEGVDKHRITFPSEAGTLATHNWVGAQNYVDVTTLNNRNYISSDAAAELASAAEENAKTYTGQQIESLVGATPEKLNTIEQLAKALRDNPDVVEALEGAITNKQDKGNYITYTTHNPITVAGVGKVVYSYGPPASDGNTSVSSGSAYFPEGIIMGGSAASAGLMARGICGISTPDATTGACTKDNLYINYDSTDTYNPGRQLILQAGSAGSHYGNNLYQYAAARGDAVKGYCDSTYVNASGDTMTGALIVNSTVRATSFKADATEAAIRPSDSNEISLGSNANYIYIGYDNRIGSTGVVDTYYFGRSNGTAGAMDGDIVCGSVSTGRTVEIGNAVTLQYNSTNECLDFIFT